MAYEFNQCADCYHQFTGEDAAVNQFWHDCCPECASESIADNACVECGENPMQVDDWCPQCLVNIQLSEGETPDLSDWGLDANDYLPNSEVAA